MNKKYFMLLTPIFLLGACGQNGGNSGKVEASINVPNILSLDCGSTYNLFPTMKEGKTSKNNFTYYSRNRDVCDVDSEGHISSYNAGTAEVVVYSDDNYNGEQDDNEAYGACAVTVNNVENEVEVTNLYISSMSEDTYVGSTYKLYANALPTNATHKKMRFISSNPEVTTVDDDGNVTNIAEGLSCVTAYNDKNNNGVLDADEMFKKCFYSVKLPETQYSIYLDAYRIELKAGETYNLKIELSPKPSETPYFGYESSNSKVAIASGTKVTALAPGVADFKIRYSGCYEYFRVIVSENSDTQGVHASRVKINHDSIAIKVGESMDISTTVFPSSSVDNVLLSTSTGALRIDGNRIIAVERGNAILTATASEHVKDSISVYVYDDEEYEDSYFNNYYKDLTWENKEDLVNKLHTIIRKDFTALGYATSPTNWESNQYADEMIDNNDYVDAIYTDSPILKIATNTGWQREHVFAASLMTGLGTATAVSGKGRATDFHNLYAADKSGNASRGNKNFGYADPLDSAYQDKEAYKFDRNNFEPSNGDKGKVARALFYMSVMYNENETSDVKESWTFKSKEDIESHSAKSKTIKFTMNYKSVNLVENIVGYNNVGVNSFMAHDTDATKALYDYYNELAIGGTSAEPGSDDYRTYAYSLYQNDYSSFSIGNLSTLIKWNSYGVDAQEMQHCESVYSHVGITCNKGQKQGNRNPFVDYPELVNYIFGPLQNEAGSIRNLKPSCVK